jgi:hypothetical protein
MPCYVHHSSHFLLGNSLGPDGPDLDPELILEGRMLIADPDPEWLDW